MNDDYESIRKQAEERVKKRHKARENMEGFVVIMGFLWIVWVVARIVGFFNESLLNVTFFPLLIISFIWGISAFSDWYDNVHAAEKREHRYQQEVTQEIERELNRRALEEKRKRLYTDDEEMVEIPGYDIEFGERDETRQHNQRDL